MNGKFLSKLLGINALHSLYREDGKWYHHLKKFPAILFDRNGYVIFQTSKDYENNPYMIKQKDLHITNGISSLSGYVTLPDFDICNIAFSSACKDLV